MGEDETVRTRWLTASHKVLQKNNLPLDVHRYWGKAANRLGYDGGKSSKSWLPAEKK
jgi:hypothetical protein|tara:strand:+ start:1047 stop:1217 length:171 start_codon:yes stop_codon:yes gene_type:complete